MSKVKEAITSIEHTLSAASRIRSALATLDRIRQHNDLSALDPLFEEIDAAAKEYDYWTRND